MAKRESSEVSMLEDCKNLGAPTPPNWIRHAKEYGGEGEVSRELCAQDLGHSQRE